MQSLKLFLIYFIELSMLFIFVSVIVGFINQKYKNTFQKHLSKDSYFSYFKAIFLGSLTPFCSCSTIPLLRALLNANVAFGVCMAYLFTSPLINPIIVVMLFLAFGLKLTLFYIIFLYIAIFIIALFLQSLDSKNFLKQEIKPNVSNFSLKPTKITTFSLTKPATNCCDSKNSCCEKPKNNNLLKTLFYQSLKDYKKLIPYIAIGMGIGALIHGFAPQDFLQNALNFGILSIVFAALIGVLLYIRVEAIIPIGIALLEAGVNEGMIFSFLIAGAGCSLPELILLKSMFKTKFLAIFIGLVLLISICFGGVIYVL